MVNLKKRLWFETFFSLTEDAVGNITPSKYSTVSISHGMRFCKTTCSMYSIKKKQQLAKLYVLSSRLCQLSQLSIQDSVESAMKKKPHTQPCLFTVFTFKRIFWINDIHQNTSFDLRCLWIFFLSFFSRTCCVFLVVVCWTSRPVTFLYTNKNYRFVKYSRRPSFSLHYSYKVHASVYLFYRFVIVISNCPKIVQCSFSIEITPVWIFIHWLGFCCWFYWI